MTKMTHIHTGINRLWSPKGLRPSRAIIFFFAFTCLNVCCSKNGPKLSAGLYERSEEEGGGHLALPFRFERKPAREDRVNAAEESF